MKKITIIGCTGSIGTSTLEVIRLNRDIFEIVCLSAGFSFERDAFELLIQEFKPQAIYMIDEEDAMYLSKKYEIAAYFGTQLELLCNYECDLFINSVVGSVGLVPTVKAIEKGFDIGLANKETLVVAGEIIMKLAKQYGVNILPIDSEHSAIFQCLRGEDEKAVKRLVITASGGSFRDKSREQLIDVTVEDALNHPNWSMGSKITIDSATMMNKGLEVIEAYHLFGVNIDQIDVILHRQSIVHSMVEFDDCSVMAQLGSANMQHPISFVLNYPNRLKNQDESLDLIKLGSLTFEELSFERYPCIAYAYEAIKVGHSLPCVLNASNEAAVHLFLNGKIRFLDIEVIIRNQLNKHELILNPSLEDIINLDSVIKNQVLKEYENGVIA